MDGLRFSSKLFPPNKGSALFPLLSKINHSCAPNCFVMWLEDCSAYLVPTKPLSAGVELTIDYLGAELNVEVEKMPSRMVAALGKLQTGERDQRRQRLKTQFGFDCKCEVCIPPVKPCKPCR